MNDHHHQRSSGPLPGGPTDHTTQPVLRPIDRSAAPLPTPTPPHVSFPPRPSIDIQPTLPTIKIQAAFDEAQQRLNQEDIHRFQLIGIFRAQNGKMHEVHIHARRDDALTRAYLRNDHKTWAFQNRYAQNVLRQVWFCLTQWPESTSGYWHFADIIRWDQERFEQAWLAHLLHIQERAQAKEHQWASIAARAAKRA